MNKDKLRVLLVDDSPDDRFFMRIVLERSTNFIVVGEARDGQEAIDYLQGGTTSPDIVLMDLKMPRKNGFDVLQWMQSQDLKNLTVAVISGSWLEEDIARSMALGAHAYFKKTSIKAEQEKMIGDIQTLLHERGKAVSGN